MGNSTHYGDLEPHHGSKDLPECHADLRERSDVSCVKSGSIISVGRYI